MHTGLYSASTGLHAAEIAQQAVAQNLAHLNVPGYRQAVPTFETFEAALGQASTVPHERLGTYVQETRYNFEPGEFQETGRKLDFAIAGDGFFVVEGPEGPLYTRNGVFFVGIDGSLVNSDGLSIGGSGGPIVLPRDVTPSEIVVDRTGRVTVGDLGVGQLEIVAFEDPQQLESVGSTLFRAGRDARQVESVAKVMQGTREGANISVANELVRMITIMRHYEASQRSLRTIAEAIQQSTRPQG